LLEYLAGGPGVGLAVDEFSEKFWKEGGLLIDGRGDEVV
jgi:hypothetical protein